MREIKFRGLTLPGKWVYGIPYTDDCDNTRILPDGRMNIECDRAFVAPIVDPETVGEFTGLKDKNGKEIYEGDRIENEEPDGRFSKTVVEFHKEYAAFMCVSSDAVGLLLSKPNRIVIGNIHEDGNA